MKEITAICSPVVGTINHSSLIIHIYFQIMLENIDNPQFPFRQKWDHVTSSEKWCNQGALCNCFCVLSTSSSWHEHITTGSSGNYFSSHNRNNTEVYVLDIWNAIEDSHWLSTVLNIKKGEERKKTSILIVVASRYFSCLFFYQYLMLMNKDIDIYQ